MHNIKQLSIYTLARKNLRSIALLQKNCQGFGDLTDQMQRAAISVISNIAEGAGCHTDKQFRRFLSYAKASNNEIAAQLDILCDLGRLADQHPLIDEIDKLSAMIEMLIRRLSG